MSEVTKEDRDFLRLLLGEGATQAQILLTINFRQAAIKTEREQICEWLRVAPPGPISVGMEMDMMARHRAADVIASGEHEVEGAE